MIIAQENLEGIPTDVAFPLHPPASNTQKIFLMSDANTFDIYTRYADGSRAGGLQMQMKKNQLSLPDSLNTSQTRWGLGIVRNHVGSCAWAWLRTASLTSNASSAGGTASGAGSWTSQNLTAAQMETAATNGGANSVLSFTQTSGDLKEYQITVPSDGKFTVAFLATAQGAEAEVSVAGTVLWTGNLTGNGTTNPTTRLVAITLQTLPGQRTIRVRHTGNGTGTKDLYLLGVNFCSLEIPAGRLLTLDTISNARNTNDYISNASSENWYAFWDADAGKYGGGFHGGETDLDSPVFVMDGAIFTPSIGVPVAFRSLTLTQRTLIDWTGSGGGSLEVASTQDWSEDGTIRRRAAFNGSMRCSEGFTHMCGSHLSGAGVGFTDLRYPYRRDLADQLGKKTIIGRAPEVWQRNPTTGQYIIGQYNLHKTGIGFYNRNASGHIEMSTGSTYAKQRSGPVDDVNKTTSSRVLTVFQSVSILKFK